MSWRPERLQNLYVRDIVDLANSKTPGPPLDVYALMFDKVNSAMNSIPNQFINLEFSPCGTLLVAPATNRRMFIYDVTAQSLYKQAIYMEKYGVGITRFMRFDPQSIHKVLHTSTLRNHSIRLLDIEANAYEEYFTGHSDAVISLTSSPIHQNFASTGLDNMIRLWDKRRPNEIASMEIIEDQEEALCFSDGIFSRFNICAIDQTGTVLALSFGANLIGFYDLRKFSKWYDLLDKIKLPRVKKQYFTTTHPLCVSAMEYSPDNKKIAVNTADGILYVLSWSPLLRKSSLDMVHNCVEEHPNYSEQSVRSICRNNGVKRPKRGVPCDCICCSCHHWNASFTPDSKFVMTSLYPNGIACFGLHDKNFVARFNTPTPMKCVAFNPKMAQLVTSNSYLWYWAPGDKPTLLMNKPPKIKEVVAETESSDEEIVIWRPEVPPYGSQANKKPQLPQKPPATPIPRPARKTHRRKKLPPLSRQLYTIYE